MTFRIDRAFRPRSPGLGLFVLPCLNYARRGIRRYPLVAVIRIKIVPQSDQQHVHSVELCEPFDTSKLMLS